MKLSVSLLFAVIAADDKKVPPRHPLQRLERLNQFTEELLNDWFDFLPSQGAWIKKFKTNGKRMADNFIRGEQRCGHYDEEQLPHGGPARKRRDEELLERYNREDPAEGVKQLTTGYRKWAERYLSKCSGQKKFSYQINRMNRWNDKLQGHLAARTTTSNTSSTSTTTEDITTTTGSSKYKMYC